MEGNLSLKRRRIKTCQLGYSCASVTDDTGHATHPQMLYSRIGLSQIDHYHRIMHVSEATCLLVLGLDEDGLRLNPTALFCKYVARPSADNPARTVRYAILHGLHDEAGHIGEANLLLKMQARERT